ncbi:DUF2269 family protein [Candidatus Solirubrobacter pratensis]|uniref:DUF2269 family protein n=1 Tax=Candidatus Solirubrobacter pratensis TaxID=1298857 RepID=UPI000407DF5D|nr:DUF2269 family protein [Candidatus Solirubrobacter pratensis]
MLASITALSISVWIHVTAALVGFGATFAEAVTFPVAMKLDKRHLPYVHKLQLFINQRLATPALVVILITGFYQVSEGDWSFGDAWISLTFLIVIILGGLLGAYFVPTDRKLFDQVTKELASGGELSQDYLAAVRREGVVGSITGILIVIALFLMITKP